MCIKINGKEGGIMGKITRLNLDISNLYFAYDTSNYRS